LDAPGVLSGAARDDGPLNRDGEDIREQSRQSVLLGTLARVVRGGQLGGLRLGAYLDDQMAIHLTRPLHS
jgi:hypothetical protein